jgi:hypothetical protein
MPVVLLAMMKMIEVKKIKTAEKLKTIDLDLEKR